jgi:hypothetical protein
MNGVGGEMSESRQNMMLVNIKGRVFALCKSRNITDPCIINYYTQILEESAMATLNGESTVSDFNRVLSEQILWLESELDQGGITGESEGSLEEASNTTKQSQQKKATGYVPEAKSMDQRLKDRRLVMEHLLLNDCITLKLTTPKQAKKHVSALVGRDPDKAEEDVVADLRNALHEQVSKFIRKHNGGPWDSLTEQTEVRMQIAKTKTLQSLVNLSKMLLGEREEWMLKSKNSLVGRLFGGRVKMEK